MFKEILRIKPVLDNGTTSQMENNLSARFARVAQRFGGGLRAVIKGSFLGISLGLISRLLNPIEALEDKIKKLLGEGTDVQELAEKFGSTPGQVRQIQDVAHTLGVTPDQFKDMITKYSAAIEKGREELANPFTERSEATIALKQFVEEKDIVKSFTNFLSSLKAAGEGQGTVLDLGHGEKRQLTGMQSRQRIEKEIFGEAQTGATRRLIESNIPDVAKAIKEPDLNTLNQAFNKASNLANQKRVLDVQNQTQDFVNATNKLTGKMVADMAIAERLDLDRETRQLESYEDLRKAANGIEQVKGVLQDVSNIGAKAIGYLGEVSTFIISLKNSRLFRGMIGKGD